MEKNITYRMEKKGVPNPDPLAVGPCANEIARTKDKDKEEQV